MHHTVELPLTLHLLLAPQAEAAQSLRRANVTEHRFYYRHAVAVNFFALGAIHSVLHPVSVIG